MIGPPERVSWQTYAMTRAAQYMCGQAIHYLQISSELPPHQIAGLAIVLDTIASLKKALSESPDIQVARSHRPKDYDNLFEMMDLVGRNISPELVEKARNIMKRKLE